MAAAHFCDRYSGATHGGPFMFSDLHSGTTLIWLFALPVLGSAFKCNTRGMVVSDLYSGAALIGMVAIPVL
eukprot:9498237-Pyramimonas_sp.AAC.2